MCRVFINKLKHRPLAAIGKAIGQAVGSDDGERPNMGVWITPQASYTSRSYQQHAELYLSGPITTAKGSSTNNLLNLSDSRAQDFFFGQFEELILTFNCSRVWFDYSKCGRPLCVSFRSLKAAAHTQIRRRDKPTGTSTSARTSRGFSSLASTEACTPSGSGRWRSTRARRSAASIGSWLGLCAMLGGSSPGTRCTTMDGRAGGASGCRTIPGTW